MRAFLVIGDKKKFKSYLEVFVRKNSVKPYNIFEYDSPLKIGEVRGIKKMLSGALPEGEYRVVVVPSSVTFEAQNALLKTIEELPRDTFFLIHAGSKDNFLPTVISRCSLIYVGTESFEFYEETTWREYLKLYDIGSAMKLAGELSKADERGVLSFLARARKSLHSKKDMKIAYEFLCEFFEIYQLIEKNNLNKRLIFENLLISKLKMKT